MGLGFSPLQGTNSRHLIPGNHPDHPRGGRPKGSPNKYKSEASELSRKIITSPEYVQNLTARAIAGTLPPAVEVMLWYFSYGKPLDKLEIDVKEKAPDYSNYSKNDLAKEAAQLAQMALLLAQESKEEVKEN